MIAPQIPNYSNGGSNQVFRGSGPGPVRGIPYPQHARSKTEMMGDAGIHGNSALNQKHYFG